jgi:CheY-like chemotaxis protein
VVDDNSDVTGALAMLLEVLGHQVQTAASGAEALELAERECPRVALLDIGLPDMDGLELAQRLRERYPDRDRLLLVAVSGYGHAEARARSLAAGFDRHLSKPVDRQTLQALLAELS